MNSLSIRPSNVRRFGGANGAVLLEVIDEMSRTAGPQLIHDPTGPWWRASRVDLAEQTGLSVHQVRTALDRLIKADAIEVSKHRVNGLYDQTRSYRPVRDAGAVKSALFMLGLQGR